MPDTMRMLFNILEMVISVISFLFVPYKYTLVVKSVFPVHTTRIIGIVD